MFGVAIVPVMAGAQAAAPRAMALKDWYRVTTVSQPALSPDGRRVAMTVTTVRESENKRHQEIWVAPTSGGAAVRWTSPSTESSAPRWSPDGKYLVFTSTRPGGTGNTWALRVDEPGGEATQLKTLPNGSVPASGAFAVWAEPVAEDTTKRAMDAFSRMPPMARPPFEAITRPVDPARYDGRHVVDMTYKSNERGFVPGRRSARTWRPAQLWRQPFGDTARVQLTRTAYSHRNASVSPDGRWIAFVADARLRPDSVADMERDSLAKLPYDKARDEAERNDVDVYVLAADGSGAPRKVAEWMGAESDLTWSPDSRRLAFIGRPGRTKSARLYVVDATGGTPRNLIGDWRFEPSDVTWLRTGVIQFTADIGGRSAVLRADASGTRAPMELVSGRRRVTGTSYDDAGRTLAFVATSMTKPTELFLANADGTNERKVTTFNDALDAEVAWADAERFTYPSVGGLEIEAWLMKPHGWQPGKKYPLVVYIHGGPHSAYGEGWFDEFQNLAAMGMYVLFTNPRGSSGYGADFTYATRGRWGLEDYEDIMKAVDIAAQRPDVDAARLGATGGSYGGFMTTWIATRTTRFRAIQTDRTITDWTYWYGASDAQGLTEFEFYGKPWDNQQLYDTLSPIRYVNKVRTPMLIVQSEEDHRTPMGSAELWFMALKKQGVPVELVRYPRSNHDLSRTGEPWLLVDRLGRLRQWFAYWLQDVKEWREPVTAASSTR
jgi:dipeptidyl aminopeptidase/acylaminoacyl peptidase